MLNRRMPCSVVSLLNSYSSVLQGGTVFAGGVGPGHVNTYLRNLYEDSIVVNCMACSVISCVKTYRNVLQGEILSGGE